MSKIDDGGAAFPLITWKSPDGMCVSNAEGGMSLRDHLAGQALIGLGTWMPGGMALDLTRPSSLQARAEWAYAQADAMIAARKGGEA